MAIYAYYCPIHGEIDSTTRDDWINCPQCGCMAIRRWRLKINAESARHRGRWDPQVGAYVQSEREFNSLLSKGRDDQSAKLNMDVKLATADARDHEALAELAGHKVEDRHADLEGTRRVAYNKRNK